MKSLYLKDHSSKSGCNLKLRTFEIHCFEGHGMPFERFLLLCKSITLRQGRFPDGRAKERYSRAWMERQMLHLREVNAFYRANQLYHYQQYCCFYFAWTTNSRTSPRLVLFATKRQQGFQRRVEIIAGNLEVFKRCRTNERIKA